MSAPGDLLLGQGLGAAGADRGQSSLGLGDGDQLLFPIALQRARDDPVLGLAAVKLAAGAVGVLAGALELEFG